MNTFRLCSRGYFAGEFIITTDAVTYSIGGCIQVKQTGDLYQTAITITDPRSGGDLPIFALPLLVDFGCPGGALEVELQAIPGRSFQHWLHCLSKEDYVEVVPVKMTFSGHVWYAPNINGRVLQ